MYFSSAFSESQRFSKVMVDDKEKEQRLPPTDHVTLRDELQKCESMSKEAFDLISRITDDSSSV